MLDLRSVTLLSADTANPRLALRALERSRAQIRFARAVLLTDATPAALGAPGGIDVVRIDPLRSRDDYSHLMLKGLLEHVATPHVLVVQWDGYAVNAAAFDPAFLACDYIGAKWFWYDDAHRVGNGGFSLRSRRLLEALQDRRVQLVEAEDLTIGRAARPLLENAHGIRYASEQLADRFSFEAAYPIGRPFGFHGLFNFARVEPHAEIAALAHGFSDAIARSPQLAQLLRNCMTLDLWDAAIALARRRLEALPDDVETRTLLGAAQANATRAPAAGRNDPCPCGSGKRFKHCHGALQAADRVAAGSGASTLDSTGASAAPSIGPSNAERTGNATLDPTGLVRRGMDAHQRGDHAQAERDYRAALAQAPGHPFALHYLGVLAYQRNELDVAVPQLERAVAAIPAEPEFHNNLGLALAAQDRLAEAIAAYRRALTLDPAYVGAWTNLGLALAADQALDAADAAYRRALELAPGLPAARWNRSLALLACGDYAEGWREYEARLSIDAFRPVEASPGLPRWTGDAQPGERLVVDAEQGLGDALQFIRFARVLAERGLHVIARVPRKLAALVATVPGVAEVSVRGATWPTADAIVPLLSIAGLLAATPELPRIEFPYLAVDAARRTRAARTVLARATGRRAVGIAWRGARDNANDRRRSIALHTIAPLFADVRCAFHSLQHDDDAEAGSSQWHASLARIAQRIDFDDMAALIDVLDLVITVDTSVAHLAGALGKPVWVLLPFAPDWRWGIHGDSTPWYPSARLFRQPRAGAWDEVVASVAAALDGMESMARGPPEDMDADAARHAR